MRGFLALLLPGVCLLLPAGAFAQQVDPCTVTNDASALEHCNMHKMFVASAVVQGVEGGVWTTASIICTVACALQTAQEVDCAASAAPPLAAACPEVTEAAADAIVACKVADGVAAATDVAGGISTVVLEQAIVGKFDAGQLTGVGISVMGSVATMAASTGTSTITDSAGNQTTKLACPIASILDWVQTAIRWTNMGISVAGAIQSATWAAEQRVGNPLPPGTPMAVTPQSTVAAGTPEGTQGGGFNTHRPQPKLLARATPSMQQKLSPASLMSSAATAGGEQEQKMMDSFKRLTHHDPEEVFRGLMDGQSPMQIAQEMIGGKLDGYDKMLASLDENKEKLADQFKDESKSASKSMVAFESTGKSGGGKAAGAGGSGVHDISNFMANFLPGKKAVAEKAPEAVVDLGAAVVKKDEIKDGLHATEKSIFDIVTARYQFLQVKFLAGENLSGTRQPASDSGTVPGNLYLKH